MPTDPMFSSPTERHSKNPYEHKEKILDSTPRIVNVLEKSEGVDAKDMMLFHLIPKEIKLAPINDNTQKQAVVLKMSAIMDWWSLGLKTLALRRLAKLVSRLGVEMSRDSLERILQAVDNMTANVVVDLKGKYGFKSPQEVSEHEEQGNVLEKLRGD